MLWVFEAFETLYTGYLCFFETFFHAGIGLLLYPYLDMSGFRGRINTVKPSAFLDRSDISAELLGFCFETGNHTWRSLDENHSAGTCFFL